MSIETPGREPLALVTNETPTPAEPDPADEGRKLAMEAMRNLAEGQLDRAERVRLSARQTFVYVSGFFAVAQVITFTAFGQAEVKDFEQNWIVRLALGAAISLAITGVLAILTDRLREVSDMTPKDIAEAVDKAEGEEGVLVADRLTKLYADTVKERSTEVEKRRFWMKATTIFAILTVAVTLAEIVISLAYRLP